MWQSVTARSIMRLADYPEHIVDGNPLGQDPDKSEKEIPQFRGKEIAMIFQDPLTTLNPVLTVGDQILKQLSFITAVAARLLLRRWEAR